MENKSRIQELIDDVNAVRKCGKFLWKKRNTYIIYSIIGAVLSLVVSFSIPKTYCSSVLLAPETTDGELGGNISSVAGLAGLDLGGNQDAFTVDLYPTIVSSYDFILGLSEVKVKSSELGIETTYSDYLLKYAKYPWWIYPVKWLKATIAKLLEDGKEGNNGTPTGLRYLSKKEYAICGKIQDNVRFSVEKLTGVVSVAVYDQDPEIASIVAENVVERLNDFILEYRTSKARKRYEYTSALCDSTKLNYLNVQDRYVKYVAAHQALNSPVQKAEMDFLEKEVDLAFQSYNTAMLQNQMAQAKILESTPVYTVMESSYVPLYADSPKKMFMLIVFVMLSCVIATIKVFYSEFFSKK